MNYRLKEYIISYFKANWLFYLLLFIFFISGVVFGSFGVKAMNNQQSSSLGEGLNLFLDKLDKASFSNWSLATDIIEQNILVMLAIYILGLTIIGFPFIMVILFTRGFRLGFTIGFLIKAKAAKGILLAITSILPHNLIYIPAYFIAGAASMAFSISLIRGHFVNRTLSLSRNFIKYSLTLIVVTLLVVGGGLLESYVTPVLVKLVAVYLN